MRLKDRVAIVTGASDPEGIGAAIAIRYAEEGAKVVIADIMDGNKVVETIKERGGDAIFMNADVSVQDECNALAKTTVDEFGKIDVLVNNAAMFRNIQAKRFTEISTEEWNQVMTVNTTGPFHCTKAVFPYLKKNGGKIINTVSSTLFEGPPGMPHYIASKGAVFAFTRCMARELGGFNICVNSLAPGYTQTGAVRKMQDKAGRGTIFEDKMKLERCLKRTPSADEVVGTAVFLASGDSDFVTGQLVLCDGGLNFN